jgi:hypothetical protein
MERTELIREVEKFIEISEQERSTILSVKLDTPYCQEEDSLLRLCFWVHQYNIVQNEHGCTTVQKLQHTLERVERMKINEIDYYKNNMDAWKEARDDFQKQLNEMMG